MATLFARRSFGGFEVKVIDFRFEKRTWGHNFELTNKLDEEGNEWEIAVWLNHPPERKDIMILGTTNNRATPYQIVSVEGCGNPNDMYFVHAKFIKSAGAMEYQVFRKFIEALK